MATKGLSANEKSLLYGLVRYPDRPDKEIAQLLGMGQSTFTTIKQRLRQRGYYKKVYIPAFQSLGMELLSVVYVEFNPGLTLEERVNLTKKNIEIFDEIFLSWGELGRGFSLACTKDYTVFSKINDIRTRLFADLGILGEKLPGTAIFPFETSTFNRFFDFEPLLRKSFGLDMPDHAREMTADAKFFSHNDKTPLSKTEAQVLYQMVKEPESNNHWLAKETGLSRHTIAQVRYKIMERGFLRPQIVPNLHLLDYEILSLYTARIDPSAPSDRTEFGSASINTESVIFNVVKPYQVAILSVYKNYDDFKREKGERINALKRYNYSAQMPINSLFSITSSIFIKNMEFAPLLKAYLGF